MNLLLKVSDSHLGSATAECMNTRAQNCLCALVYNLGAIALVVDCARSCQPNKNTGPGTDKTHLVHPKPNNR